MFTSFSTALSALTATASAIDVVGNDLANLNTPGFKTSDVVFHDLVSQSLSADLKTQVGFGTGQPLTIRQFTQGAIQTTGGLLDAAIEGNGFFVVRGTDSTVPLYTRAGNFKVDKNGNLLTATGEHVQGWSTLDTDGSINNNGPIGDITVPVGTLKPPKATTTLTADLNLDSASAADATSAFSAPITVYDSLGAAHALSLTFQKTGPNTWSYQVNVPGDEVTGGTKGTPFPISGASGTLTFGQDGKLTDPAAGAPIQFQIPGLADGASDMSLTWNLYDPDGTGKITQFGQKSAYSATTQDGKAAAQLVNIALTDGGTILASYSNDDQVAVGQVALASIRNPDSLIGAGNNNFQTTADTAEPAIGVPGTGGRGSIVGGSIESSTVDIAREFTNLIVYQRGYEANSRVVTTTDTLSQDTINLIH
jgi:flagellar hook protein FlgE